MFKDMRVLPQELMENQKEMKVWKPGFAYGIYNLPLIK